MSGRYHNGKSLREVPIRRLGQLPESRQGFPETGTRRFATFRYPDDTSRCVCSDGIVSEARGAYDAQASGLNPKFRNIPAAAACAATTPLSGRGEPHLEVLCAPSSSTVSL
jgi:hypothetical protein